MRLVRQWPLHERQVLPLLLGRRVLQISSYPVGIFPRVVANIQVVPAVDFLSVVDHLQVTAVIPVLGVRRGVVEVRRVEAPHCQALSLGCTGLV